MKRAALALDIILGVCVMSNVGSVYHLSLYVVHPLLIGFLFAVYAWVHARNRFQFWIAVGAAVVNVGRYFIQ